MTFAEAFADARKRLGPGKTFTYKGKKYTTDRADDVAPSKNNVDKAIDVTPKKKPVEKKTPTKDRKERREIKQEKDFVEGKTNDKTKRDLVPDNVQLFVKDLLGFQDNYTEEDFGDTTLEALRKAVKNAIEDEQSYINYADYDDPRGSTRSDPIFEVISDPDKIAKTTIGAANFGVEDGNLVLTDKYNFNDANAVADMAFMDKLKGVKEGFEYGPYQGLRAIGTFFGSGEGDGSDIKINLGPASNFYNEDQLAGIMSTQAAKDIT